MTDKAGQAANASFRWNRFNERTVECVVEDVGPAAPAVADPGGLGLRVEGVHRVRARPPPLPVCIRVRIAFASE